MSKEKKYIKPSISKSIKLKSGSLKPDERELFLLNSSIIESAFNIAQKTKARLVLLILEDPPDRYFLSNELSKRKDMVLVLPELKVEEARKVFHRLLTVPNIKLNRMGRIKLAVMRAIANNLIEVGDKIVCITGVSGFRILDTVVVLDIGKEYELFSSQEAIGISSSVHAGVFEELLNVAVELAHQGREGKPVGTLFVLGDTDKVMALSRQMIFNPFQGYPEEERNILDPRLRETIKEFASLDGAFIIRDDGVIVSAGRHLNASLEDASLPQGLGARHAAAAGITELTNAVAIVISESTGDVRIFRKGKIFMEIEKTAPTKPHKETVYGTG